jgi:Uma2 family endonuclease
MSESGLDRVSGLELDGRPIRRFCVDEYHRLIEAGVLGEDEHAELIDGVIFAVAPQGPAHAYVVQELNRLLVLQLGDEHRLRPQLPATLDDWNEPEPDLAIVLTEKTRSRKRHPDHALVVIEVAESSLRYDRQRKAPLYASRRIPEYWIVNVSERSVEVHRDPDPAALRYQITEVFRCGQAVVSQSVPAIRIEVAGLFE